MIGFFWACFATMVFWMLMIDIRFELDMDHLITQLRELTEID